MPAKPNPLAVKDAVIKREAGWLRTLGGSVSASEIDRRVARGLERAAARSRDRVARPTKGPAVSERREKRRRELAERSNGKFFVREAKPIKAVRGPRCGWCNRCVPCRRAGRLRRIIDLARQGDEACATMSWDFYALANACQAGTTYKDQLGNAYPFGDMRRTDRNRAFETAVNAICDRSVNVMGAWR